MSENTNEILLFAEITKEKFIHTVFFELAQKSAELAGKLGDCKISAMLFTEPDRLKDYKDGFLKSGIDKVYVFESEKFQNYNTELYSKLAIELIKEINPKIILIGATNEGRDLAPRISSALHTGLTADCTDLDINEKGQLAATRPTFGGKLMATILCKTLPQMATVRPKVFKPLKEDILKETDFIIKTPDLSDFRPKTELLEFVKTLEDEINELDSAEIIVAGGKGAGSEAGFEVLREFAKTINGTIGATRGAVDMGIAPKSIQIGQTGKTVRPKVYIACGISGAIQHLVGMQDSEKIIAINTDENAPIFEIADFGIVGDMFKILPELTELLKKN